MNNFLEHAKLYRQTIQRLFFGCVLLILVYRFFSNSLIHQIGDAATVFPGRDFTSWILIFLKIPEFISGNRIVSILFDVFLFMSALGSLIFTKKRIFPIVFAALYFLYFLMFNLYSGHRYHGLGILFLSVPFLFQSKNLFSWLFACCRYYFLFILVSASLWKICRGTPWNVQHFSSILKAQNLEFIVQYPEHFKTQLYFYLIENPGTAHALWMGLIAMQFLFILGFLTYKLDRLLILFYLIFAVNAWLLMNIISFETSLFLLTLLPFAKIFGSKKSH